ncbi:MAG: hypothetical protein ACRDJH_08725 [Thermomicrobiales bacterium]
MIRVRRKEETVDIANLDDLYRVVKEVRKAEEPLILVIDEGQDIVVDPAPRRRSRRTREEREQADYEAFLSSAGSWKGLIDPEEFKRQIRAGRGHGSTRSDDEESTAPPASKRPGRTREKTEADYEATMSTFGAWKGLVDTEQMKKEVYAARGSKRRTGDR